MYLGFSRILLICTIFIQLLQTDCRTTTKRRDRVRRTLISNNVGYQKESKHLNRRKVNTVWKIKSALKRASFGTRFLRRLKPEEIKAQEIEKEDLMGHAGGKDLLLFVSSPSRNDKNQHSHPILEDADRIQRLDPVNRSGLQENPKPKTGVFGHMANVWKAFGESMVDFFLVFLDGIRRIFKRNGRYIAIEAQKSEPEIHTQGVSQEALKKNPEVDDLKSLAWELLVNPTKKDSVVADLYNAGLPQDWGFKFKFFNGIGTPLVKKHFDDEITKLGIKDTTGMAENYPKGWEDFTKTLKTSEEVAAFSHFEDNLVIALQKIPPEPRKRITQVMKKYQDERSSQSYGSSSKVA